MTVLAVFMVLAVLESTLPSFCLSYKYKIQHNEATVAVLTVLAVSAVMAVSVMTATPLKLNPPFPWSWSVRGPYERRRNLLPKFMPISFFKRVSRFLRCFRKGNPRKCWKYPISFTSPYLLKHFRQKCRTSVLTLVPIKMPSHISFETLGLRNYFP